MANEVLFERHDVIGTITLNRPEALNAINIHVVHGLLDAVRQCDDDGIRVVVLKGAGRAFCAGDDLKGMGSEAFPRSQRQTYVDVMIALRQLRKPVIAQVHGYAYGAGCELTLACDLRIAAAGSRFAEPFALRGITTGTLLLIRYLGLGRATEMLFTGEPIETEEALRLGVVNRVVPPEQLEATVQEWAERLGNAATLALWAAKSALNRELGADLAAEWEYVRLIAERDVNRSEDRVEGVRAFVEKRAPQFKGR